MGKLSHEVEEALHSIMSATADIQRWTLQIATNGRVSRDRKTDMEHQARRIKELVERL